MSDGVPLAWALRYQCYDDDGNPSGTVTETPESGIYEIYRDGEWLTTVTNVSAYTDCEAKAGESHGYNVHYEGLCWDEDMDATCYKSAEVKLQAESIDSDTFLLSVTATISTYDWADAEKTQKVVTTVETAYEAESDCDWLAKSSPWPWLMSGESSTWKIAANPTTSERKGRIRVYPYGNKTHAATLTITQKGASSSGSTLKLVSLKFWAPTASGAGPSYINLGWRSEATWEWSKGFYTSGPYNGPYSIYKDGRLYCEQTIQGERHSWSDYGVKVGETYHYRVVCAGNVIIDTNVLCQAEEVYRAEKPNYTVSSDGGMLEVPFYAEIQRVSGGNTDMGWSMGKDSASSWLRFYAPVGNPSTSGTGNGAKIFVVDPNTTPWTRTATVTIAPNPHVFGKVNDPTTTFTITQCGSSVNWEVVDGVRWEYSVNDDGTACVGCGADANHPAIEQTTAGAVVIPATLGGRKVTGIGDYAFYGCSKMTSVVLPEGVEEVGASAFANCSALKEIRIASGVKRIGAGAFANCKQLGKVDVADMAGWCGIEFATAESNPLMYSHGLYHNGRKVEHLVIPNEVSAISDYAFYGCWGITALTMRENVKSIGASSFRYCTGLTRVRIPACAVDVKRAFPEAYEQIESVVLDDDVTVIGEDAFNGCTALKYIVIPERVLTIEARGLCCQNLEHIAVYSDAVNLENGALWMCNGLTTVSVVEGDEETVKAKFVVEGSSAATGVSTVNVLGDIVLAGKGTEGRDLGVSQWWCCQNLFGLGSSELELEDRLGAPSGKSDGAGHEMYVWQDYVAGTDPAKPDEVFKASIAFDGDTGKPVVSWTPELIPAEAAKREYKIYGKVSLGDEEWTEVKGNAADFNFFKVTVEMK